MATETHQVPPGSTITVGPGPLDRVAAVVAIIRDVLFILFMVSVVVVGARLASAVATVGTDGPASVECIGEEPC